MVLSTLRFSVVVLMSIQTAEAIGLHIPVWQMAAAIPFVVFASVIALTPGGLGVNELTSVSALRVFGTPLAVGGTMGCRQSSPFSGVLFFCRGVRCDRAVGGEDAGSAGAGSSRQEIDHGHRAMIVSVRGLPTAARMILISRC